MRSRTKGRGWGSRICLRGRRGEEASVTFSAGWRNRALARISATIQHARARKEGPGILAGEPGANSTAVKPLASQAATRCSQSFARAMRALPGRAPQHVRPCETGALERIPAADEWSWHGTPRDPSPAPASFWRYCRPRVPPGLDRVEYGHAARSGTRPAKRPCLQNRRPGSARTRGTNPRAAIPASVQMGAKRCRETRR